MGVESREEGRGGGRLRDGGREGEKWEERERDRDEDGDGVEGTRGGGVKDGERDGEGEGRDIEVEGEGRERKGCKVLNSNALGLISNGEK